MDALLAAAETPQTKVHLYQGRIEILRRSRLAGFVYGNSAQRQIPLRDISHMDYRPSKRYAWPYSYGYISFVEKSKPASEPSWGRKLLSPVLDSNKRAPGQSTLLQMLDPNTVLFWKQHQAAFERLRDMVIARLEPMTDD